MIFNADLCPVNNDVNEVDSDGDGLFDDCGKVSFFRKINLM